MNRKLNNDELGRLSPLEFAGAQKSPVVLVLDNVRSLHNIGSVFRTADAFRVSAIYLCGITATPPNREIHKTALGATESVAWKYFSNTAEALDELIESGHHVYAVEQAENSIYLQDLPPIDHNSKLAFVFGHEVNGVAQEIVDRCHAVLEIPQFGTKHSFNISVTAAMVLWECFRKTGDQSLDK